MPDEGRLASEAKHEEEGRPLRIAVLAHALRAGGGVGVGKNMIESFGRVGPEHTYFITIPAGLGYEKICDALPRKEVLAYERVGGLTGQWAFETFALSHLLRRFRPDVLLSFATRGLSRPPCPQAIVCQMPHLFYPPRHYGSLSLREWLQVRYHRWHLARDLRATQIVFCQTTVIRDRLRWLYGYTGESVVCSKAVSVDALIGSDRGMPSPLVPYAAKTRLLCLARYYCHKNLERLVETLSRYRNELSDVVVVLTISKDQHPKARSLLEKIEREGLGNSIVNVGPLSPSDLATYYGHCQGLLMPTLLESFSATYVEAMHFGVPILTSDLDFARDVCGDAAVYFDPWRPESIRDAILRLRNEAGLPERLVAAGRQRLSQLPRSWDSIAENVLTRLAGIARPVGSSGDRVYRRGKTVESDSPEHPRPLRIAVLAHALHAGGGLGVGKNMIAALGRLAPHHTYLFAIPAGLGYEEDCAASPLKRVIVCSGKGGVLGRVFFDKVLMRAALRRFRPDVVLGLGNTVANGVSCPQAFLVHQPHLFYPAKHFGTPTLTDRLIVAFLKRRFRRDLRRSSIVFCQTSVIQERLRALYRFKGSCVLCPNALAGEVLASGGENDAPCLPPASPNTFRLIYLTRYYCHKNIEGIVETFDRYRSDLANVVVVLTIAANQHPNEARLLRTIEEKGLSEHFLNVGPVAQNRLAGLYRSCQGLLMPTSLESYSGTYLEAMHFGLPILTSDLDFAHEVCGDAALYFDPWKPESIRDAILRIRSEPALAEDLVQKGRCRLQGMGQTWDHIAAGILAALGTLVEESRKHTSAVSEARLP
jgi:glycosyltransferase involved in cell wall biosynthesis